MERGGREAPIDRHLICETLFLRPPLLGRREGFRPMSSPVPRYSVGGLSVLPLRSLSLVSACIDRAHFVDQAHEMAQSLSEPTCWHRLV